MNNTNVLAKQQHYHVKVNQACVLSKLLYGRETWTLYSGHLEGRLNALHPHCLRRILSISWQDRVTNKDDLAQVGVPSMWTSFVRDGLIGTGRDGMGEFLRAYSTVSLQLELDLQEGLPFVSKTFVNDI